MSIVVPRIRWINLLDVQPPTADAQVPVWNISAGKWIPATVSGVSGSISSLTFNVPAIFNVVGSPLTTSGTISFALIPQGAALVLASPATSSGIPTFRGLLPSDIPPLPESQVINLIPDLAAKAPLASPAFTGTPTAPTALPATNNIQLATTAFVQAIIANLINSAPGALDTLGELATQLSNDESALNALITTVAGKLTASSNLADLTNAATARNSLGLGSSSTHSTSDYAAAIHTHSESDITSLVSDLASKAAISHTHSESEVVGLVSDLATKAPIASPTHTGTTTDANLAVTGDIAHAGSKIDKVVTLTYGSTVNFDLALGDMGKLTLGGNPTLTVSNGHSGSFRWKFIQDGTGSRVPTFPSSFKFSGGSTLSTAPGAVDVCWFSSDDGGTTYEAVLTTGHA